ncbi:MAG: ribosome-associated heat shock protein Hsp15 [Saprospiraceae bacterium]|jgi:ribosome-associated heat shock protein Hsp15
MNKDFSSSEKVRIDRWLWASRFYKTRQDAIAALKRGNIAVNGQRAKPAKLVGVNDQLTIRKNQVNYEVKVLTLAERRVAAKVAQTYYLESDESLSRRQLRQTQVLENRENLIAGKPNKKDRRTRADLKRNAHL